MDLKVTQVNKEPKDQWESRVFRAIKENLESKVIEELKALLVEKKFTLICYVKCYRNILLYWLYLIKIEKCIMHLS